VGHLFYDLVKRPKTAPFCARIKKSPTVEQEFEPEKLSLRALLETKRAPIPEEKKTELAVEAAAGG
jgi:hypothetical protein